MNDPINEPMQSTAQRMIDRADSIATYCAGGGLAWLSCIAQQLQPILSVLGLFLGGAVCALKGYYDWRKHRREEQAWREDGHRE